MRDLRTAISNDVVDARTNKFVFMVAPVVTSCIAAMQAALSALGTARRRFFAGCAD